MNNGSPESDKNEFDWQMEQRMNVVEYLKQQNLQHGKIARWPAWHAYPYLAIFPIESYASPGRMGWWAICGDCPIDYVSFDDAGSPRSVMRYFAKQWDELSAYMLRGEPHPLKRIGSPETWSVLGDLLLRRSKLLQEFAGDDSYWVDAED